MFRRVAVPSTKRAVGTRAFTDYHHYPYPTMWSVAIGIPAIYFASYILFMRMGTIFTKRAEFKKDYLRIWRRKLGKGYKWSDEFGPQIENIYKNIPARAE